LFTGRIAGYADGAGLRLEQTFHGAERAGLTGPVGTQEPEDLTRSNVEAYTTDCLKGAIIDVEAFHLENEGSMVGIGYGIVHVCKYMRRGRKGQ
jgi:hypothetical protein